jgi:hypothetical protein
MIHKNPLPTDIEERLRTLGQALERCSGVVFAYLFGGAAASRIRPLSDVDVAATRSAVTASSPWHSVSSSTSAFSNTASWPEGTGVRELSRPALRKRMTQYLSGFGRCRQAGRC